MPRHRRRPAPRHGTKPRDRYAGPGGPYEERPGDLPDSSGGGPGGPAPPPPEPPEILPGFEGMPPDVQARVDAILRDGAPGGPRRALAYIRTTPWYAVEYRGISAGVRAGLFGADVPEAEYRSWRTGINQQYRQFYGRDATGDELDSFLGAGYTPTIIGQIGQGKAIVAAERPELQYLGGAFDQGQFSEAELTAYGEQKAGRSSALGTTMLDRMARAMEKVNRVFQGQLATSPALEQGLGQTLQQRRKPDIAA
jgi:hypothetical protein